MLTVYNTGTGIGKQQCTLLNKSKKNTKTHSKAPYHIIEKYKNMNYIRYVASELFFCKLFIYMIQ